MTTKLLKSHKEDVVSRKNRRPEQTLTGSANSNITASARSESEFITATELIMIITVTRKPFPGHRELKCYE